MKAISLVILFSIAIRILFILSYSEVEDINQWEYGAIVKNLLNEKGYSLFYFESDELQTDYDAAAEPFPSAYMMPGYTILLIPFFLTEHTYTTNFFIALFQILLAGVVTYFIYLLTVRLFDKKAAIVAALIYAVMPEFIYSVISITPTILFHLGIVLLFLLLTKNDEKNLNAFAAGVLVAAIILFRSEFLLFAIGLIGLLLLKKYLKKAAIILTVILLFLTPWIGRNYLVFDSFIPFNTSFGINLYRGNNPEEIGGWGEETINEKIEAIPRDKNFELNLNKLYTSEVVKYMGNETERGVINIFVKVFHLWVFNPHDNRTVNLFYLISSVLILFGFVAGLLKSYDWSSLKYLYLFFLYSTIISMIFFSLPRYQTMMKAAMIPIAAFGLIYLYQKLKFKIRAL